MKTLAILVVSFVASLYTNEHNGCGWEYRPRELKDPRDLHEIEVGIPCEVKGAFWRI